MRITPFSARELEIIKEPLQGLGWKELNDLVLPGAKDGNLKYFIDENERLVNLTMEYYLNPPFQMRKYFPIGRLKLSLIACPGVVPEDIFKKLMLYWAGNLKEIEPTLDELFTTGVLGALPSDTETRKRIVGEYLSNMPEPVVNKDENYYYQRLRFHLAGSGDVGCEYAVCKHLVKAISECSILATNEFEKIEYLSGGIPPSSQDTLLAFKNPNSDEFVFLEPGFLTYYRDATMENVLLRIYFDSFAMHPLNEHFKVDLTAYYQQLFKGLRLAFTAFLNASGLLQFKKVYFFAKNFQDYIKKRVKNANPVRGPNSKELVFPFPNVLLDILQTTSPMFPQWNFFIKPPETFDELVARRVLIESQRKTKQGNFNETIADLTKTCMPVFNKSGQKYAFFLTLLELARLAVKVNNYEEARKKFTIATEFAKKNEEIISPDELATIQEEHAAAYIRFNDPKSAIRQYTLLFNYLEKTRPESDEKKMDILLKLTKIYIKSSNFANLDSEIRDNLRAIKQFGDKHKNQPILTRYYLTIGAYELRRNRESPALGSFKKALKEAEDSGVLDLELNAIIKLAKLYLHGKRRNHVAAFKLLERGNVLAGQTENLKLELAIYELLHDYYNQVDDMENAGYYSKQAGKLRIALKMRGLL